MTSQRVERTWICTGGNGRFRGESVNMVPLITGSTVFLERKLLTNKVINESKFLKLD